mgnify:CR=1 FL=1
MVMRSSGCADTTFFTSCEPFKGQLVSRFKSALQFFTFSKMSSKKRILGESGSGGRLSLLNCFRFSANTRELRVGHCGAASKHYEFTLNDD